MNTSQVISQAWELTWKHKHLWIFGFLAGLTFGGMDIEPNITAGGAWLFQNLDGLLTDSEISGVILTGIISISLWVLGAMARICLIHEVATIELRRSPAATRITDLARTWFPYIGSILLMQLLVWLPVTVLQIISSLWTVPAITSLTAGIEQAEIPNFSSVGELWLIGGSLTLLMIPLTFLDAFSYRSIVIEKLGLIDGIRKAYQVIITNLHPILGLTVLCILMGFAFSLAVSFLLSPLAVLLLPAFIQTASECASEVEDIDALTRCIQGVSSRPIFTALLLLVNIISAAISSVWVTFQSAAFTSAYTRLIKK